MFHLCSRFQSHPGIRSLSFIEVESIYNEEMLDRLATIEGLESFYLDGIEYVV
ncbi:hypothetical protein BDA99DRAFT_527815 [Phascolomyces articulosus]|uniref:Uncharacterized protein n=1 Tax=Phascolomyces articulosus TaxID=60185 RepID=A0AAD5JXP3_9FUNG|nr:hypothetical protein BDA99DRAFT_527815 [Phascolomyces articulosus]